MAMNRIQFQRGLSLSSFLRDYGTEELCEAVVVAARWPQGVVCDRCGCTRFSTTHNGQSCLTRFLCDGVHPGSAKLGG